MAFSGPYMCNIYCNHEKRNLLVKSSLLKKWHFLDLVCLVHVVTITTGSSYSNRSLLKKWHFLDLLCSVHVVTITIGFNSSNRNLFKKCNFLDLICAIYIVTVKIEIYLSNPLSQKVVFSRPSMFSTCSNHYNWAKL